MPYARKDLLNWEKNVYYHIYNRGAHQTSIFRERTNYLFVIGKLKEYARKYQITVIAYCLMPTHYHICARQDGDTPAGHLPQYVFNSYTKAYNLRYSHSGTLFEGRFRAKPIRATSHLLHLCRYIHGNPVKDGLVAHPADWEYSNYLEWSGERNGTLVDREFICEQFGGSEAYRAFLLDYLRTRNLPEDVMKFLGDLEK